MTVYADHVDNNIWIETAEGKFVKSTETMRELIESNSDYNSPYCAECGTHLKIQRFSNTWYIQWGELEHWEYAQAEINGHTVVDNTIGNCGNETEEREYIEREMQLLEDLVLKQLDEKGYDISKRVSQPQYGNYHEVLCEYWYMNRIQDEYTYTILPLPDYRPLPQGYETMVKLGIHDGLEQWGRINDIKFTYTDSKLRANIIIQQQVGDGKWLGNAVVGCLLENNQCTIQLFTDVNVNGEQTLVNRESIEFTIAHEFGHLIGLPHHIDPGHVMKTSHANNVRTYYEVGNVNVPKMYEPVAGERLWGSGSSYNTQSTTPANTKIPKTLDEFVEHQAWVDFITTLTEMMVSIAEDANDEEGRKFLFGTIPEHHDICGVIVDEFFSVKVCWDSNN